MVNSYKVIESAEIPNVCVLSKLVGVEKEYQLTEGVSLVSTFSNDAAFLMDPDFPNDTLLADNLINKYRLFVASKRLKEFLEKHQPEYLEFLPVGIIDHRGKRIKEKYFIVHPINPLNCLDIEKCGAEYSLVDESEIDEIESLVFDDSKMDHNRQIFRPKFFNWIILIHSDLAAAIDAEGFTGIRWIDSSEYSSNN